MPTAKPRITITLTEHQHAVLARLSVLQRASMSSIVVDLLDTTLPVLERLAGVLQNAASAPQDLLDQLRMTAESAETEVASVGYTVTGLLDELLILSSGAVPPATVGRQGASPDPRPPTSNRGVRKLSPASKLDTISPMKKGEKNGRAQK